jgi:NTE family protein
MATSTALVLAGGGSFGAVQVGMLRALVAHGVVPDLVVGWTQHARAPRPAQFPDRSRRAAAHHRRAPALPQTRAGAHSAARRGDGHPGGTSVRLSKGPVVEALLASCAIPAAFPPVRIGQRHLIDGAVASNTPLSVAVELGARRLVVLPTGFACALEAPPADAIGCALHAITLLIARQLVTEIERCRDHLEVITVPPLCPLTLSPYDFSHAAELIARAADQTTAWLAKGGLARAGVPAALRGHAHTEGVGCLALSG